LEPTPFGKYLLQEQIAEGGMAVVWRAKLLGPDGFEKILCLKQIREELVERREFVDLFVAEAKTTVALSHANIVPVYELGRVEGTYYLALELVDGPPLSKLLGRPFMPALAAYIIEQILRGLAYAHGRGVVHRDMSPANVLCSRDGEVKIADFGIAAPIDARGVHGGSRGYVAPEQESGGRADARSDLYCVGVLLWELLSGRRFNATEQLEGPAALVEVARRATAREPAERYPDAPSMLAALNQYLRGLTNAPGQGELSEYVRKEFPDVPHARASDAPETPISNRTGPSTKAIPRSKQVTFATGSHFAFPEEKVEKKAGRGWPVIIGAALLVGGGVAVFVRIDRTTPLPVLKRRGEVQISVEPAVAKLLFDGRPVSAG
jgi:serine/threonine-protein kinase